jgi:hypothetical protein
MIQNLSLRGGTTKQSQKLGDYAIASFRFASFAMTIGHFITWSTLNREQMMGKLSLASGNICIDYLFPNYKI